MNPVLHGTLKYIFTFVGNIFFWPLTLLFLSVSGFGQLGAVCLVSILSFWLINLIPFAVLIGNLIYMYLATGVGVALMFDNIFGTFKNARWVYPMAVLAGIWVGILLVILL